MPRAVPGDRPAGGALAPYAPDDEPPREDVDQQGEHEQHQPGGEQSRAVHRGGRRLAELDRDRRGQSVPLLEDRVSQLRRVADHQQHRDRLADRPAEAQHGSPGDAGPGVREHRHAQHLPTRRPQGQRCLLVLGGYGGDDLAGDRRDDRQDHDGQDQAGDEVAGTGDRAADKGQERERAGQRRLEALEVRDEHEHPPQPVDHRRNRRQQVDQHHQRPPGPTWTQLGQVQGGGDCHRHPDDQRDRRDDQRPDDQRRGAEGAVATVDRTGAALLELGDIPVVAHEEVDHPDVTEGGRGLPDQPDEEVPDQDQHARGQAAEAPVQDPVG